MPLSANSVRRLLTNRTIEIDEFRLALLSTKDLPTAIEAVFLVKRKDGDVTVAKVTTRLSPNLKPDGEALANAAAEIARKDVAAWRRPGASL